MTHNQILQFKNICSSKPKKILLENSYYSKINLKKIDSLEINFNLIIKNHYIELIMKSKGLRECIMAGNLPESCDLKGQGQGSTISLGL